MVVVLGWAAHELLGRKRYVQTSHRNFLIFLSAHKKSLQYIAIRDHAEA